MNIAALCASWESLLEEEEDWEGQACSYMTLKAGRGMSLGRFRVWSPLVGITTLNAALCRLVVVIVVVGSCSCFVIETPRYIELVHTYSLKSFPSGSASHNRVKFQM